ncbi:HNH endonuclease [Pendulispora rubella]|uniref:HNH endonuclease n=1 Tax=Pendulispora rubella TaxID=2741070 RepID=A0ABZ2KSL4_9BACT
MIRGRCDPLSSEQYQVQFTASAELKANRPRRRFDAPLQSERRLSVLVERAVDLLLAELEKRRLGKTTRPAMKAPHATTRAGYVTRSTRREVFERDGEQCTFVDESGRRCECRTFLELDHIEPRARGGSDDPTNLRIRCKWHNALAAEQDFGREHIEKKKAEKTNYPRQRGYEPSLALRALTSMGFRRQQAIHALSIVENRRPGIVPPIESVLRDALVILT